MLPANCTLDSCESTNDLVRALGEAGHAHGTWLRARLQTRGRGRHGRTWVSQSGNLFLSVLVRDVPVTNWSWVPLASAVAAARVFNSPDVKIKWPNDLWLKGAKFGGVLSEGVSGARPFLVVGIGLNLFDHPENHSEKIFDSRAFYEDFQGPDVERESEIERVRKGFLQEFLKLLESVSRSDFGELRADYERTAQFTTGTRIHWRSLEHFAAPGVGYDEGDVIGLGPHAELQVLNSRDEVVSLFSEEVMGVGSYVKRS